MLNRPTINRSTAPGGAANFAILRQEGVQLLQELSGGTWTDYNLHDPGVTVLEQLCYALTDLIYRTGFDPQDYLVGEDGTIDFDEGALYRPEDIFPSGPVTINDYRKLLFDGIPDIDNVWVKPSTSEAVPGLYRVYVQITAEAEARGEAATRGVIDAIHSMFAANRNLGEDLEDVMVVTLSHYRLQGTVEVNGDRNAAEILAEIYYRAARYMSASLVFRSFDEVRDRGDSLDRIFTGPLTTHVCIDEEELGRQIDSITISELNGIIGGIEGATRIRRLYFENEQGQTQHIPYNPLDFVPHLQFPENDDEVGVNLYAGDRAIRVSLRDIRGAYDRLNSEYRSLRQIGHDYGFFSALPRGEFRHLEEYFSVLDQFPNNYGVNRYGIPETAPPRRKAQARQLKAYLLFFEQVMANFLENLRGISRLFSRDDQLERSYFYQVLTDREIPDVNNLYQESAPPLDERIAGIVGRYDNFGDRRSRVLDYLLAIYGERFAQGDLRHFNYYYTVRELEQEVIRNKLNLLKLIGGSI
jgi:hypothetical protein